MRNKSIRLQIIILLLIIAVIIIPVILFSTNTGRSSPLFPNFATPTPIKEPEVLKNTSNYDFTPFQTTEITKTTDDEIKKNNTIVSQEQRGGTTIYQIDSKIPGTTDEIRTNNGVVIFESTSVEISTPPPPTLTQIERVFGKPEEIKMQVGDGFYLNAYLYPAKGFVVFANRYTGTVYTIHRFPPMTVSQYETMYAEFLTEATTEPEYFDQP